MSESTVVDAPRVVRRVTSLKEAKKLRDSAVSLGANVSLRAGGHWLDNKNDSVVLEDTALIRDIKSVWIEADLDDQWMQLRQNGDPNLNQDQQPYIEIEFAFPD